MPTTTPENASDLYKSQITDIAVPSPANKAAAVLLTPINGKQIFVNGSDGGWFTGVTGLTPGTLADDGGAYCGTVFIPTGGDGSAGWERPSYRNINSDWFNMVGDDSTDDTAAWLAFVGACESQSKEGFIQPGTYLVDPFAFSSASAGLRLRAGTLGRTAGSGPGYFGVDQTVLKCRTAATAFVSMNLSYDINIDGLSLDGNKIADSVLYFEGVANNVNVQWRNAEHYGAVETTGKIHFYDGSLGGEGCNFYNIFLNANHNRDPDSTNKVKNCLHVANTNVFLGTYEKCWFSGAAELIRYGAGSFNLKDCEFFHATNFIITVDATTQSFEVSNGYSENSDNVPFFNQAGASGVDIARPIYLRNNVIQGLNQGMNLNCQQPVVIEGGSYSGDINVTPMATYGNFINTISDVGFPTGKGLTGAGVATHCDFWNISVNEVYVDNQIQNIKVVNNTFLNGQIRLESQFLLADAGATPTVLGHASVILSNSVPQNVTNFTSTGISTQLLFVGFADANTTLIQSSSLKLTGSANVTPTAGSILQFLKVGASSWQQAGGSIK